MGFARDVRYSLRAITRSPGYALTSIAVLALGIGANAAIFSAVYSVILTPLPYPDVDRQVFVWERLPNMPDPPGGRIQVARKNYLEWKRQNTVFQDMAAFRETSWDETGIDRPRHVSTGVASSNVFTLLGARTQLGRLFTAADDRPGSDRVAVLTDTYFESRFHRNPSALGKSITLSGAAYTVIGVLPPGFHLPATWEGMDQIKPEVWVPLSRLFRTPEDDVARQLLVIAKLKPGVSLALARTEMAGIAQRLEKADPQLNEHWTTAVHPFTVEDTAPSLHRALYVLLAAVAFLLLIGCANLANLTLARGAARSREIAIRLALGGTRGRIVAQLMAEALVIAVAGAAAGLLLAHWSIQAIRALELPEFQRPELIELNLPVFAFAALVSLLTAVLFGLAPALAASRAELSSALKSSGGGGASAGRLRMRQFLIASEVALALMMLSGAGLMLRSFRTLVTTGIGFDTSRLTGLDVDLPESQYRDDASRSHFFRALLERVQAAPGVVSAGVVDNLPLHRVSIANFHIAGQPEPDNGALPMADFAQVSPEYFHVLGLPLRAGRQFTSADLAVNEKDGDGVVIINEAFARKFFASDNPIGKRLLSSDRKRVHQVIGVVADYRPMGTENGARPQLFWPYLKLRSATLVVRTHAAPESMAKSLQDVVWSLDKGLPANQTKTLDAYLDYWLAQRRFNTLLLSIFAGLALVLALLGIYGVLANLVASRTREIGIRMAIGASRAAIAKLVIAQSMAPVSIGLAVGLAGSLVLSRLVESLLYQVRPRDPLTLALAVSTILVLTPVAVWLPVRRATRVDCTTALREE
jgi:putative ABC transport system permease protein